MVLPDGRWLEILKQGGVTLLMLAAACGLIAYLGQIHLLAFPSWVFEALLSGSILFGLLAVGAAITAVGRSVERWWTGMMKTRANRRAILKQIPLLTLEERKIIGDMIGQEANGRTVYGMSPVINSLVSKGFLRVAIAPGMSCDIQTMPVVVPEDVWELVNRHRDQFPPPPERSAQSRSTDWMAD